MKTPAEAINTLRAEAIHYTQTGKGAQHLLNAACAVVAAHETEQKRACDIVTAAIFGSDEAVAALVIEAAKHQRNAGPLTPDQQNNALQLLQAIVDCKDMVDLLPRLKIAREFLASVKAPTR